MKEAKSSILDSFHNNMGISHVYLQNLMIEELYNIKYKGRNCDFFLNYSYKFIHLGYYIGINKRRM